MPFHKRTHYTQSLTTSAHQVCRHHNFHGRKRVKINQNDDDENYTKNDGWITKRMKHNICKCHSQFNTGVTQNTQMIHLSSNQMAAFNTYIPTCGWTFSKQHACIMECIISHTVLSNETLNTIFTYRSNFNSPIWESILRMIQKFQKVLSAFLL